VKTTSQETLMPFCRVACILAVCTFFATPLAAQSFNCRDAEKPDEVLICQNPQLAALDERMASMYFRLRNNLAGEARAKLEADQTTWLRERYGCGRDAGCIRGLYERRIAQLANY
jgi:uncharacterized protein